LAQVAVYELYTMRRAPSLAELELELFDEAVDAVWGSTVMLLWELLVAVLYVERELWLDLDWLD
jgi:hypothetical protein